MPTPQELDAFLTDLMPRLGVIARAGFENPGTITWKVPGQPVTATDREIERVASEAILSTWPDHAILGEEHGTTTGDAPTTWYIDPIDGTMNFSRGLPFFSISIGASRHDEMIVGHVLDPLRNELFHAAQGSGAWVNDRPLNIPSGRSLRDANVSMQTSAGGAYMKKPGFMRDLHRHLAKTRKLGSIALEMAYVAAGRVDLLIGGKTQPQAWWDIAGGWAVIEEAGGVVLDLNSQRLTPQSSHLVAGEPELVRAFIEWFDAYPG